MNRAQISAFKVVLKWQLSKHCERTNTRLQAPTDWPGQSNQRHKSGEKSVIKQGVVENDEHRQATKHNNNIVINTNVYTV